MNKNKNVINIFIFVFLSLVAGSAAILSAPVSFADNSATTVTTVIVTTACSITADNTIPHTATILPGHEETEIGNTTMTVVCNDNSGSSVYAVGFSNDEWKNTNMVGADNNTIPTGTGTSSSNWSMKLSVPTGNTAPTIRSDASFDYTDYERLPNEYVLVATFPSDTDGVNNSSFNTTYRAYVSNAQPAGTYAGKVKFTLVHPNNAVAPVAEDKTIANSLTMQEVESCPGTIPEGQIYTLSDPRDGSSYRVAKLADDKCWMLDNLALDITAVSLNDLKGKTNADDDSLTYLKNGGGTGHYATSPVSKAWTSSDENYFDKPMIAVDSDTSGPCSNDYCVNGDRSWSSASVTSATINGSTSIAQGKIGVYYNYCAASAGYYCYASDAGVDNPDDITTLLDSKYDICPKGWRLPTSTESGEFQALYASYSGSSPSQIVAFQTALSTVLSGHFWSGKASAQGTHGYFWSSTWNSASNMYRLDALSNSVGITYNSSRDRGSSVRCVLAE